MGEYNSFEDIRENRFTQDDLGDVEECSIESLKVNGLENTLDVGGKFESIQLESSTFKTAAKSILNSVIMKNSTIEEAAYSGGSINLDHCVFENSSAPEKAVNADFTCQNSSTEIASLEGTIKLDIKNQCLIKIEQRLEASTLLCDNGWINTKTVSDSYIQISRSNITLSQVINSSLVSSMEAISPSGSFDLSLVDGIFIGEGARCSYDNSGEEQYCEDLP